MTVGIEISGEYAGRKYNTAEAALKDVRKQNRERIKELQKLDIPMKKASIYLDRWVQSNFKSEGGKVGGWQPFARGGRVTSDGIDTSARLLQDTGRLRASFLPFATKKTAGISSDLDYAKTHEYGTGDVPMRRMLPEKADVIDDIRRILKDFAVDAIKVK